MQPQHQRTPTHEYNLSAKDRLCLSCPLKDCKPKTAACPQRKWDRARGIKRG